MGISNLKCADVGIDHLRGRGGIVLCDKGCPGVWVSYQLARLVGVPACSHIPPACAQDRRLLIESAEEQPASFSRCHLPGKEKPSIPDVKSQMCWWVLDDWNCSRSPLTLSWARGTSTAQEVAPCFLQDQVLWSWYPGVTFFPHDSHSSGGFNDLSLLLTEKSSDTVPLPPPPPPHIINRPRQICCTRKALSVCVWKH